MIRQPRLWLMVGLALLVLIMGYVLFRSASTPWPYLDSHASQASQGSGLNIHYFGTSTLAFDDGRDVVMIDGYFSRPSLWPLLTQALLPNHERQLAAMTRAGLKGISAVMVSHTHFDHALDAPSLAAHFGARLLGSEVLGDIARAEPRPLEVEVFKDHQPVQVGAFRITAFETPHSPGDIARGATGDRFNYPARANAYPMGTAYSFLIEHEECRILVVPSAGQVGPRLVDVRADVVFLGVGRLASQGPDGTAAYWRDTVAASEAALAVPIHWDDFSRPLDEGLRPLPFIMDRFDLTIKRLTALAEDGQVVLALAPTYRALDLSQLPVGGCSNAP